MVSKLSATWIIEIVAAVFSVLSFAALVLVLYFADGQVVLSWHHLSLNTVISILGTATKASAMFVLAAAISQSKWAIFAKSPRSLMEFEAVEQAGRGTSGAVKLLLTTRKVATVGAVAILLSLAFDPFTQQLIQFVPDVVYTSNSDISTTLPYAQRYSLGFRLPTQNVIFPDASSSQAQVARRTTSRTTTARRRLDTRDVAFAVQADADFSMQSAVLYGLTNDLDAVHQQTDYTCLTGNCTYPLSETVAVCSVCNDLKSSIETNKTSGAPGLVRLDQSGIPSMEFSSITRFQLPNGAWIDNGDGVDPFLLMTWFGTANQTQTVGMQHLDTLIWSITMLRAKHGGVGSWPGVGVEATECAVYYCVKSYNTTIHNSTVIQESTVVANATRDPGSWQPSTASVEYHQTSLNSSFNHSLAFNDPYSAIDRSDLMLAGGYNVSQAAVDGTSSFFEHTFSDPSVSDPNVNGFFASLGPGNVEYVPSAINTFWRAPDLGAIFTSLAESMTNTIRAHGDGHTADEGRFGTNVTKFSIHWVYIILPASIVLCAVVQLGVTMWESRAIPLWKASTLATLSRGRFLGPLLDEAVTVGEMEGIVKERDVHLFSHTAPGGVAAVANARGFEGGKNGALHVTVEEVGRRDGANAV